LQEKASAFERLDTNREFTLESAADAQGCEAGHKTPVAILLLLLWLLAK
jgi:hypothetical protein